MEINKVKMIVSIAFLAVLIPLGVIQSRRGVSENVAVTLDGQMDSEAKVDRMSAVRKKKGRTMVELSVDGKSSDIEPWEFLQLSEEFEDIQTIGNRTDPVDLPQTTNFMPAFRCQAFKDNGVDIPGLCDIKGTGQSYTTFGGQGGLHGNGWWPMDEMDLSAVPYTVRKKDGTDSVTLLDQFKGLTFKKTTKTCKPNPTKYRGKVDFSREHADREKVRCDCLQTQEECLGSYIEAGRVKPGQPKSAMPTFYSATSADTQKFIMRVCMWNENPSLGNWCSISYTFIPPVDNGATKVNDVCGGGSEKCPAMSGTGAEDCPGKGEAPCETSAVSQGI